MYIWTLALTSEEALPRGLISDCRVLLSVDERARADRFMFGRDRNRYVVAHALCRLMLSKFGDEDPADWVFTKEEKGRPFIDPAMNSAGLDFNISHTQAMVGCALSKTGRIGFDLEPKERQANLEALAEKQFSTLEQRQFNSATQSMKAHKFFEFWTLKEAYIKLTGNGLSEGLANFSFDLSGVRPECYLGQKHLADHEFGLFDVGGKHQGAWAYRSSPQIPNTGLPLEPEHRHLALDDFYDFL